MTPANRSAWTTREISRGGVLGGMILFFLVVGRYAPGGHRMLGILCGVTVLVALFLLGRRRALLVFAATALLGNLFAPSMVSLLYLFFYGSYPFIKLLIESRIRNFWLTYPVKIAYFLVLGFAMREALDHLLLLATPRLFYNAANGGWISHLYTVLPVVFVGIALVADLALTFFSQPLYNLVRRLDRLH